MILLQNLTFDISRIGESGLTISWIGYAVVFAALVLLYFMFSNLSKLLYLKFGKRKEEPVAAKEVRCSKEISGETNAAISAALHLYFDELHDEEHLTLTIQRVPKRYSPWSSKIYGVVREINRKF